MFRRAQDKSLLLVCLIFSFRHGYQWQYKGGLNINSLASFLRQGFQTQSYRAVVKPIDIM